MGGISFVSGHGLCGLEEIDEERAFVPLPCLSVSGISAIF